MCTLEHRNLKRGLHLLYKSITVYEVHFMAHYIQHQMFSIRPFTVTSVTPRLALSDFKQSLRNKCRGYLNPGTYPPLYSSYKIYVYSVFPTYPPSRTLPQSSQHCYLGFDTRNCLSFTGLPYLFYFCFISKCRQ